MADTDDEQPGYGRGSVRASPVTTLVHFIGGPWHGGRGRYVHLDGFPHMHCPGGVYRHAGAHPAGGAIYAFNDS